MGCTSYASPAAMIAEVRQSTKYYNNCTFPFPELGVYLDRVVNSFLSKVSYLRTRTQYINLNMYVRCRRYGMSGLSYHPWTLLPFLPWSCVERPVFCTVLPVFWTSFASYLHQFLITVFCLERYAIVLACFITRATLVVSICVNQTGLMLVRTCVRQLGCCD